MVSMFVGWECEDGEELESAYPDATCNPRPLEPPVTTATLPSRRKMLPKFSSLTSCSADIVVVVSELDG